jgi:hypothetical protein
MRFAALSRVNNIDSPLATDSILRFGALASSREMEFDIERNEEHML